MFFVAFLILLNLFSFSAICDSKACYYGTCENINNVKYCRCDISCTSLGKKPVCGYDEVLKTYSTYENLCVMKKASCMRRRSIRMVREGYCGMCIFMI